MHEHGSVRNAAVVDSAISKFHGRTAGTDRAVRSRSDYYGTEFGLAIFACTNTVLFGMLLWWTARSLNSMDEQREQTVLFDMHRRDILEIIAKGAPLKTILQRIVFLVEAQGLGSRCSLLLFDKD